MNIFFTDEHPKNIMIFGDVLIEELDKNHSSFYDFNECILNQVKEHESLPHIGNIYTRETYKRFKTSLLKHIPAMSEYPITWTVDGVRSKFYINYIEIETKVQLLEIISAVKKAS